MSKLNDNNIEEIEKTSFNDITYYIITFRGEKIGRLLEESKLTKSEKQIYENILLNRKRKKSDNINSEKSKSTKKNKKRNIKSNESKSSKKYTKRNNKKDDNESNNNSSLTNFSNINTKQKIMKKQNKENNNIYSNKNISNGNDSNSINENYINIEKKSESENESESEKMKTKIYERQGVLLEDTPKEILNVGYKNRNDKTLYSLVRWKQSKNIKILDSIVENKKIRQIYPQLLIDFYESKIIFLED